jgi:hypothetical protein
MRGVPFLQRIVIAAFFADHFAGVRKDRLNDETSGELAIGDRLSVTFGGKVAAVVSLPSPASRAVVKNEALFLAYVRKHNPDGVETVPAVTVPASERVREATRAAYLAEALNDGVKIDGVEVKTNALVPHVKLADDAAEVIAEAWARGEISEEVAALLKILPALPAAGGDPGA